MFIECLPLVLLHHQITTCVKFLQNQLAGQTVQTKAFNTIATTLPNGGCLKVSMWVQEDGVRKNHVLGIDPTKKQNNTEHKSKSHQIISRCSIRSKNDCSFQLKHMLTEKPSAPSSHMKCWDNRELRFLCLASHSVFSACELISF